MMPTITIIPSSEIDVEKWNNCIAQSANGLIYSTYEYISAMADHWHGLVVNDYESVIALPWRKKWGIRYIYTPPFTQQLGLVGSAVKEDILMQSLLQFSKFITYNFNYDNLDVLQKTNYTLKTNLVLSLANTITELEQHYSKSLIRNLQKSKANGIKIVEGDCVESVEWYQQYQGDKMGHVINHDYLNLKALLERLKGRGELICKKAINKEGITIATIVCLKDRKRIYNLLPSSSTEGKEQSAMHLLLQHIMEEYAGTHLLFDFEGSDIVGVQQFYKQYGAINEPYAQIQINELPFYLKWAKK